MNEDAVLIAGGGPTGLMWAGELAVPIYREREVTGFARAPTSRRVYRNEFIATRG